LRADPEERERLINAFTVNETYFYREEHQLACLSRSLLPDLITTRRPGDKIRIWSAPCSTGEEAYSIAIWLLENWRMVDAYNVEIIGSDIDTRVLEAAHHGLYGERALSRLPPEVIEAYFEPAHRHRRQIINDLRESVIFTQANLVDGPSLAAQGTFDVIFCRNVLIYFDDESRLVAARNLYDRLAPGGYLCLGHTESMTGSATASWCAGSRTPSSISDRRAAHDVAVTDELMVQFLIEGRELVASAERDLAILARRPDDAAALDSCFGRSTR
jgi:chemotaxis protein methyltransferase CheR